MGAGLPGSRRRDVISVECGPRDLVVRVSMCARCGTDETIYYHGHPNVDPYAPVVLGHGLVARIVEVGSEVGSLILPGGYLFDDVVVASASPAAQRLMLRLYTREGYAVGACFGGTHRLVDAADLDIHHYRATTTIGSSGCSTDCMKTILAWLESGQLSLKGFTSPRRFTLDDDPHEFFTTDAGGLKPALHMEERDG